MIMSENWTVVKRGVIDVLVMFTVCFFSLVHSCLCRRG